MFDKSFKFDKKNRHFVFSSEDFIKFSVSQKETYSFQEFVHEPFIYFMIFFINGFGANS